MAQQVLFVHGGSPFQGDRSRYLEQLREKRIELAWIKQQPDWKADLYRQLGDAFEVYAPQFPNKQTAQYDEWATVFKKVLDLLDDDVILVGYSLGASLVVKYLAENETAKRVKKTILLAAPYDNHGMEHEPLCSFERTGSLERLAAQAGELVFYHSKDDFIVPFEHFEKYRSAFPRATFRKFSDRNHFLQPTLPELCRDISHL